MKKILLVVIVSVISSVGSVIAYDTFFRPKPAQQVIYTAPNPTSVQFANYKNVSEVQFDDFSYAAQLANPTVVHIKTFVTGGANGEKLWNPFDDLREDSWSDNNPYLIEPEGSTGSGVIASSDGYIVTNEHVINGSDEVQVILYNQESYSAKVVGYDRTTDLALLKIEATNLPVSKFGNSDMVKIGEWVLAVGNPFNLTSTVTAGIVSAKARNINILQEDFAIESFIQTDAAINSGNSGGALVNKKGELIGINTAIATFSGSYTGYSFAVPVNIVRKVVEDLKTFGVVQRAYLGVNVKEIPQQGVFVEQVINGSAAFDAGILKGDVITEINGFSINKTPELMERIARYRPGDPVAVTFHRNSQEQYVKVILKNIDQTHEEVKSTKFALLNRLGAEFEEMPLQELKRHGLLNGIRVTKLMKGVLKDKTAMREGFIITKINNKLVRTVDEIDTFIKIAQPSDGIMLEGHYPGDKGRTLFAFSMR